MEAIHQLFEQNNLLNHLNMKFHSFDGKTIVLTMPVLEEVTQPLVISMEVPLSPYVKQLLHSGQNFWLQMMKFR